MNASITKFAIHNQTEIKKYFEEQGYVVLENILNHSKIDNFLHAYEKIKRNKLFIYYSQSVHLPLRPKISPEGFIEESMENPTHLKLFPGFSKAILDCLIDENVSTVLSILSGSSSHTMLQNMFFDKSTGTIEHQDHYYVDTNPPGHLIGTWYALEDINEEAGCFFVLPGSHKGPIVEQKIKPFFLDHNFMRKIILRIIEKNNYEYKALPLNKGDVLFWHPYTIHGAYKNKNPQFSRKSFTAHFYPSHLEMLKRKFTHLKKSANPNILVNGDELSIYKWNLKLYREYFINKIRGKEPYIDMRRESYEDYSKR